MQAVREIKKVKGKRITINLPDNFSAQEVEVIVLPYKDVGQNVDHTDWKQDLLSVSQWDITEEDVKIQS